MNNLPPSFFYHNRLLRQDETIYGWLANYGQQWRLKRKTVSQIAFGKSTISAVIDFPANLQYLSDHLVLLSISVDQFIDRHTLLPAYMPFIPPQRIADIRELMRGDGGAKIQYSTGLLQSKVNSPMTLQACLACVEEDRDVYGDSTWYRLPQLPGAVLCPKHEIPYQASNVRTRHGRLTRHQYLSVAQARFESQPLPINWKDHRELLLWISAGWNWLLQNPSTHYPSEIRFLIRRFLFERGYATSDTGQVNVQKLLADFNKKYSAELLRALGTGPFDTLLVRATRAYSGGTHPLHQLLLLHFLDKSPADLLIPFHQQAPKIACYNPICPDRKLAVIPFMYPETSCPTCGQLLHIDLSGRKVLDRGWLWRRKLKEIWLNTELSRQEVLELFEINYRSLKQELRALDVPLKRPQKQNVSYPMLKRYQPNSDEIKFEQRYRLAVILDEFPEIKSREFEQTHPELASWFQRYDWVWLENRIKVIDTPVSKKYDKNRYLDMKLWLGVQQQALRILSEGKYRLSKTRVTNEVRSYQYIRPEKTPLVYRSIQTLVESKEVYQARKNRNSNASHATSWNFLTQVQRELRQA